jgi:hypothetical protein
MLRHAAEYQFPESRMTICAGDNDTGANVGGYFVKLNSCVPTAILLRHELRGGNAMT